MLFSWAMSSSYPRQNSLQASGTEMHQLQTFETNSQLNKAILPCLELRVFTHTLTLSWIREIDWAEWCETQQYGSCSSNAAQITTVLSMDDWQVKFRYFQKGFILCVLKTEIQNLYQEKSVSLSKHLLKKKKSIISIILTPRNQLRTIVSLCLVLERH